MLPAGAPDLFLVDLDGEAVNLVRTHDDGGRVDGLRFDDLVHMVRSAESA